MSARVQPVKPPGQKETLDQVWYGMYGTNGTVGLVGRMEAVEKKVSTRNGKKPRRMEVLTVIIAAIVGAQAIGLLDALRHWVAGGVP